jgi:iron complex transport system substrate-binding protein
VTDFCDYPAAASRLPKVGGYANPSVEAVLSLRPDLVIVSPAVGNRDAALSIGRAGVRVAIFPMENLADAYLAIEGIAASCGVAAQGASLVRTLRERMSQASTRAAARKRVRALFCVQLDPIIAAGAGTLPSELLEIAGGENVIRAERYPQVGMESVLAEAPQVILHARMDKADPAAPDGVVSYWKRWPTIPAVRDGRVVVFDASAALRPGPRMAMAVEQLEAILAADAPGGVH